MRPGFRGRLALWGLLFGAVGGLLDTWFLMSLGIDLRVGGRDMTLPVALYLATSFAVLCGAIGWFVDARARSRRDAQTIRDQMHVLEATQEAALRHLYFRLAVIPIHIPPLRERVDDLLPLARHFLARWSAELEREITGWSPEVERFLVTHGWPGNVRELENTIERGVVLAETGGVRVEAARRLGIDRTTLYRLMRKYGVSDD